MNVWIEAPFDSLPIEGYRKQRYWMMAEAFVRAGHRVVYWTSDFSHARKSFREKVSGFRFQVSGFRGQVTGGGEFELVMIPTRPYRRNVGWERVMSHRAYAREWERAAVAFVGQSNNSPDVIIVSAPPVSTGRVGIRLARRFGARLVVDVQDAWPETFYRLLPRGFRWVAWLLLSGMRRTMGRVYRCADLVTGVCDRYEALVNGYGAKEYYRAYLGIEDGEVEGGSRKRTVEGQNFVHEMVRVVYVGNLGKSYDLKTVVEGLGVMNRRGVKATLDIAGFGGHVEENACVKFHGMLGREELRRLLEKCDIGVIPMSADSFVGIPNKLGEYAAAGLRIVSSLKGECEALIARFGCGITYQAGDAESFADAVGRAMELPADAGRRLVEEELAADVVYESYCKRISALEIKGGK